MPFVDVSFLVIGSHFFCKNTKKKNSTAEVQPAIFFRNLNILYEFIFLHKKK